MKVSQKALSTVLREPSTDVVVPPNSEPDPEREKCEDPGTNVVVNQKNPVPDLELGMNFLGDTQPPEAEISFEEAMTTNERDDVAFRSILFEPTTNEIENEASRSKLDGTGAVEDILYSNFEDVATSSSQAQNEGTNPTNPNTADMDVVSGNVQVVTPHRSKEGPKQSNPESDARDKIAAPSKDSDDTASTEALLCDQAKERKAGLKASNGKGGKGVTNDNEWRKLSNEIKKFQKETYFDLSQHKLASKCFVKRQIWYIATPITFITMISGILAFVTGSDLVDGGTTTASVLNIIVGILSFSAVFLQTMSGKLSFDARGEMHASTAYDLKNTYSECNDLESSMRFSKANLSKGNKGSRRVFGVDDIDTIEDVEGIQKWLTNVQKRNRQSLEKCNSILPDKIFNAFKLLNGELTATYEVEGVDSNVLEKAYGHNYNHEIYMQGCTVLSEKICSHWAYPILLPNSRRKVAETMEELESRMKNAKIRREAMTSYVNSPSASGEP